LNRIDAIDFDLYFGATYKKGVIEDYNVVHVTFHVGMSLVNELYNSLAIDLDIVSTFLRISSDSWTRKTTTIIDTIVLVLLVMSSWTYVLSIFKTSRLAKVYISEYTFVCASVHVCVCVCICVFGLCVNVCVCHCVNMCVSLCANVCT